MHELNANNCTAFEGSRCIASGAIATVVRQAKQVLDRDPNAGVLIFNDFTSALIEVDYRGTIEDVLARIAKKSEHDSPNSDSSQAEMQEPKGPGRPKLGVVAREITLLPRHWDWLNTQSGGASVAIRKLVEKARHDNVGKDQMRQAQESTYKFMLAMAGNQPGYEEATRALFAGKQERFNELIESWPGDIRDHAKKLAQAAFQSSLSV
jgi:hypothetical protein